MKKQIFTSVFLIISILWGCNSKKKSDEVAGYTYQENEVTLKSQNIIVGDWVIEGTVCYGLVVTVNKDGKAIVGRPVKAKVVKITEAEIKMKSLENISVSAVKGCKKTGLAKGETWMEKEGDLFKTKEEAISYLKEKKLYQE